MNKIVNLTAATAMALAQLGAARADDTEAPRSRAEVVAELAAARAGGALGVMDGEDSGSFHLARQAPVSTLTRAEVRAAVLAARQGAEASVLTSEAGYALEQPAGPTPGARTRAQVVAELLQARASGELAALTAEGSEALHPARTNAAAVIRYVGHDLGAAAEELVVYAAHVG